MARKIDLDNLIEIENKLEKAAENNETEAPNRKAMNSQEEKVIFKFFFVNFVKELSRK